MLSFACTDERDRLLSMPVERPFYRFGDVMNTFIAKS